MNHKNNSNTIHMASSRLKIAQLFGVPFFTSVFQIPMKSKRASGGGGGGDGNFPGIFLLAKHFMLYNKKLLLTKVLSFHTIGIKLVVFMSLS